MSRRNKNKKNLLNDSIDLLALLPWWVCLVLGAASFIYLRSIAQELGQAPAEVANLMRWTVLRVSAQAGQYIVPVICLSAAGLSYFARAHRRELLANTRTRDRLEALTWHDFELLVGEAYRRQGYTVKELGGDGPDGGVDLVLHRDGERIFVQCKHWKAMSVGVDVVRQIFGVMAAHGGSGCVVVTSGKFTAAAQDFAKGRNVDLVDGPKLFRLMESVSGRKPVEAAAEATTVFERRATLTATTAAPKPASTAAVPACPICSATMMQRTARKGPNAGKSFWGCSRYPTCKGTR